MKVQCLYKKDLCISCTHGRLCFATYIILPSRFFTVKCSRKVYILIVDLYFTELLSII